MTVKSSDPSVESRSSSAGQLALPVGTPDSQTLRFKLSATNLPTKDDVGFIPGNSDPYGQSILFFLNRVMPCHVDYALFNIIVLNMD